MVDLEVLHQALAAGNGRRLTLDTGQIDDIQMLEFILFGIVIEPCGLKSSGFTVI